MVSPGGYRSTLACSLMFLCVAGNVRAQDLRVEDARQLFLSAVADQGRGDHKTALEKFQRVRSIRDTPRVRFGIASSLEALGQWVEARDHFLAVVALSEGDKPGPDNSLAEKNAIKKEVDERVKRLSRKIPVLLVTNVSKGTSVWIDRRPVEERDLSKPLALNPGKHLLELRRDADVPWSLRVELAEGETQTVRLPNAADLPGKPSPRTTPDPKAFPNVVSSAPSVAQQDSAPPLAHTLGTAGVLGGSAFLATAAAFFLVGQTKRIDQGRVCPASLPCDGAYRTEFDALGKEKVTMNIVSIVAASVGVIGLSLGIYGITRPYESTKRQVWLGPGQVFGTF